MDYDEDLVRIIYRILNPKRDDINQEKTYVIKSCTH